MSRQSRGPQASQQGLESSQRPPASQSASQATQSLDNLDPTDVEKKVNELVQYILVMDQKKLPIKKRDINKNVLQEHGRLYSAFMARAKDRLHEVFGFLVVELKDKLKGSCILVNTLPSLSDKPHLQWSDEEVSRMGLLATILTIIFMNGNTILEEELWSSLKKMCIKQDEHHPVFGNVRCLVMEEWTRQAYLEVVPQPNTDPVVKEIHWGQRAHVEFTKKNSLDLVCRVYGTEPQAWMHPWQQVREQQQQHCGGEA